MEKLTKEELVGDLLINGHIDGEEAVTLLTEKASTIINTFSIPAFDYTTTTT